MDNKFNILIVEDDLALRTALSEKLTLENFNVSIAEDGEQGLELALKGKPNLILLDIVMPKMNGLEMLDKLRKDSWGSKVPVIILTNLDAGSKIEQSNDVIDKVVEHQPSYYLLKSETKIEDISDKVKECLNIH